MAWNWTTAAVIASTLAISGTVLAQDTGSTTETTRTTTTNSTGNDNNFFDKAGNAIGGTAAKTSDAVSDAAKKTGQGVSDGWIQSNIRQKLLRDGLVKAGDVRIDSHNHLVTLSGTVPSQAARERAVSLARDTKGVDQVRDDLRIAQ